MTKSLWIVQTKSIAQGFALTNWILNQNLNPDLAQVVESSILPHGSFLILVQGELSALQSLQTKSIQNHPLTYFQHSFLESLHPDVIPAFYSLQNDIPKNFALLIYECQSIAEAFTIANEIANAAQPSTSASVKLLDLRSGRGTGGVPMVFIAGPLEDLTRAEKIAETNYGRESIPRALIETPHPQFTELFV